MEAVRKIVGPGLIVGVSVKTKEQAIKAEAGGADYLGAGAGTDGCCLAAGLFCSEEFTPSWNRQQTVSLHGRPNR